MKVLLFAYEALASMSKLSNTNERHSRFLLDTCSKCNSRDPHKSHNTALCHQLDDISEESHETALSGTDER